MKILCLYNNACAVSLFEWLEMQGHQTILCSDKIDACWCKNQGFDLTVSYTYRYILTQEILDALDNNAVNIHNSYLPWNRGADPNIWSIVEGTPRGVTLHYMDAGLDSGSIIAQSLVALEENDTLKSSYDRLDEEAKMLFKAAFQYYPFWSEMRKAPEGKGSYHALRDCKAIKDTIQSYDIDVTTFKEKIKSLGSVLGEK